MQIVCSFIVLKQQFSLSLCRKIIRLWRLGIDSYIEKVIENAVYKQLRFLGYDVKVGVLNAGEVDFVCTKPGDTVYVQASYIVAEEFAAIFNPIGTNNYRIVELIG